MQIKELLLLFVSLFSVLPRDYAQQVIRGPYLQSVTDTSIIVKWRTDQPTDSKVWFGDSPSTLIQMMTQVGSQTDHEVLIGALSAGTTYYYAIGNSGGQMVGADSSYYFTTAPLSDAEQPIRVWALGSLGSGGNKQLAVRDGYYDFIGNNHTDAVLLLGDNTFPDGTDSNYQVGMFDVFGEKMINTVFWPCPGEHDLISSNSTTQTGPYYEIFSCPKNGEAGGMPSGTEAYYSFNYGNIHFVSMDSEDTPRDTNGAMAQWLQTDLSTNTQEWTVAFWHRPPFTKSSSDSILINLEMRENILPILEEHGVDLVLNGHSRRYQRSFLTDGHYDYISAFDSAIHGINMGDGRIDGDGVYTKAVSGMDADKGSVKIVAGTASQIDFGALEPYPLFYDMMEKLGSLYFEVTSNQMDVKFVNVVGKVEDYFTIFKNDSIGVSPNVEISDPLDESYFIELDTLSIQTTTSDMDGVVARVDFYANDLHIGTDTTAPFSLDWAVSSDGNYRLSARATDNDHNVSISPSINIGIGAIQVCSRIQSSSDDAEERPAGLIFLSSPDLDLPTDSVFAQTIGMRFLDLGIPRGALITSASIQFSVHNLSSADPCDITFYGEASADPQTFSTASGDITARPRTLASVMWSPPTWVERGDAGPEQQTNDLSLIIQEIVNRPGFSDSSSICIIADGIGQRSAKSFDTSPDLAPELRVTWTLDCDSDGDGVCDQIDLCPGGVDTIDVDMDEIPDDCDDCIGQHGSSCPSGDCHIDGDPLLSGIYAASQQITSDAIIGLDSVVIFEAGNCINLEPGFEVELGGDFLGLIIQCQNE